MNRTNEIIIASTGKSKLTLWDSRDRIARKPPSSWKMPRVWLGKQSRSLNITSKANPAISRGLGDNKKMAARIFTGGSVV